MNTKEIEAIKNIGLSESQSKVYLILLSLGEAPMTEIAKKAELKRPTTYDAIDRLELLGLVSKTKRGKRFHYSPIHPRRLYQIMNNRRNEFETMYSRFEETYNQATSKPSVQIFEGVTAVQETYDAIFKEIASEKEGLFMGNISSALASYPELSQSYIQNLMKVERPKIRELIVESPENKKWVKDIKKKSTSPTHKIRLISQDYDFGETDYLIVDDTLYIFSFDNIVFVTVIKNDQIIKTQKSLFEIAWGQGR